MIKKGQSISSVAKKFSVNSDNEESYTKGKAALGTKFETAAAKLKKNQVSGVVELDDAYVIIKMLNPNDTTAAASNKSTLLQEKQQAEAEQQKILLRSAFPIRKAGKARPGERDQ